MVGKIQMTGLPKIVVIVGPTASGKSSLGIKIAKEFNGEIISVDSRQVYRGMDIGTAKVTCSKDGGDESSGEQRNIQTLFRDKPIVVHEIAHWGIDLVDPDEEFNAADFKVYAQEKIGKIVDRGKLPILVGGTGFWLQALIDNFDLTNTKSDQAFREELESRTLGDLFHEYKQLDPEGAELIDRDNKRRVVRALEVTKITGKPFSLAQDRGEVLYDVLEIGIMVDRMELNGRINHRVDQMIADGLVDEVRQLYKRYGCEIESMTGIGYRQICSFLRGESSLQEAIKEIKSATRRYAKRQMTWFKRDERITWVDKSDDALKLVETFLSKH